MAETYRIAGSYYEACNCKAICPCRRQNGAAGGLSSYGNCDFILSWRILEGQFGAIGLSDLSVCMAGTYHDDEDGSPWSVFIYIDHKADDDQFDALSRIFEGKAGGNILFTSNISKVLGVKRAAIALGHEAGVEEIRIADIAKAGVDRVFDFHGTVSCGIPGHDHPGQESVSSILLTDGDFQWDYKERCGFSTDFDYWN
jgi:hypothetical protein